MRNICWWSETRQTAHLDRGQNKRTGWHTFCNISHFIGKQQTNVTKWGRKQNKLGHKKAAYRESPRRVRHYLRRNRGTSQSWDPWPCWYSYPSFCTCNVGWFAFELIKVYVSSCQWRSLDLGNCQARATENLAPSLTSVIIFCNIYPLFVGINFYTVHLAFSLWTLILGTDLLQFLHYSLLRLREMVARYRIRSPDSEFE